MIWIEKDVSEFSRLFNRELCNLFKVVLNKPDTAMS